MVSFRLSLTNQSFYSVMSQEFFLTSNFDNGANAETNDLHIGNGGPRLCLGEHKITRFAANEDQAKLHQRQGGWDVGVVISLQLDQAEL